MAREPKPTKAGDAPAIVSLDQEREKTIALLSQHFAQDNITMDELERRIERAYRAGTVAGLRDITRDLTTDSAAPVPAVRAAAAPVPEAFAPERERITSIMSETKRVGVWRPARRVDVRALMATQVLDFTKAVLQSGVTEVNVRALMSSVKVIVPPGVRVVLQPSAIMSSVSDETLEPPAVGSGAPVVRITGTLMMTELVARVRLREQAADPDED